MKKESSKTTILVISTGLIIIYLIFSWQWTIIASMIIGIIGITSDYLSGIIEKGWMAIAKLLSYIIPSVLLGIVFFLVLFPSSLISKVFRKDPLMLSNKYKTYFIDISKEVTKKDFENIW